MTRWRLTALMALAVVLSGCAASEEETAENDPQPQLPVQPPGVLNVTLTGCLETILFVTVEPAHAQSLLPSNYTHLDVGPLLGLPAEIGRGGVVMPLFSCDNATWGEPLSWGFLGVLIKTPQVNGTNGTAGLEFYILDVLTDSAAQADDLAAFGNPVTRAILDVTAAAPPARPTAQGAADDATGPVVTYDILPSGIDETFARDVRMFHATANGTIVWHFDATAVEHKGGATSCTIRAGSAAATAFDRTDCQAAGASGFVHFGLDATGTVRLLPGVQATA